MKDICPLRIQRADFLYRCVTEWRPGTAKKRREKSSGERNGAYGTESRAESRVVSQERRGPSISDVIRRVSPCGRGSTQVFVGSLFSVGMKPNFIIAMYCLSILS